MDCSFTGAGIASRRAIAKSSKAARKIRRRKLAAVAEAASLQTEETSSTAVVQAADKEGHLDGGHDLNKDGEGHKQDVSSSTTVQPDDSYCPECQFSEQLPAALEADAEVKSFLPFPSAVRRVLILTYSLRCRRNCRPLKSDMTTNTPD